MAACLLWLGGCAGGSDIGAVSFLADRDQQAFPTAYREDLLSFLKTYLNEPSRVRDAAIAEPVLRTIAGQQRYVVCVRYNARDTGGRYAGAAERLAIYRAGRFDQLQERAQDLCAGAAYAPFPELERLTR